MEVMLSEYIRILFTVYSVLKQHLELLIGRKEEALQSNVIQIEKEKDLEKKNSSIHTVCYLDSNNYV